MTTPGAKGQWSAVALSVAIAVASGDAWSQPAEPRAGERHLQYGFPPTGEMLPYRVYVPTTRDGESALPALLFLHGAGADEIAHLDMNDGLLLRLAEQHGHILVGLTTALTQEGGR